MTALRTPSMRNILWLNKLSKLQRIKKCSLRINQRVLSERLPWQKQFRIQISFSNIIKSLNRWTRRNFPSEELMTHFTLIQESERVASTPTKSFFWSPIFFISLRRHPKQQKSFKRRTKSNSYSCNFRPSPHPHLPLVHLSDWNNERVKFFCASRRIGTMIKTIGNKKDKRKGGSGAR